MQPYLEVSHVDVAFPGPKGMTSILQEVSFHVAAGQFITLIGHSGCGKSTLLNLIAGLLEPTAGGVVLQQREISGPGPERAVVFQNHSLLPWLTVFDNVYLAVESVFGGKEKSSRLRERTGDALALVGLTAAADKRPGQISGGMKQRVGIARALAMEPKVLLMDEPFGALDALTRASLQDELMRITHRLGNTVVMVTHDIDECILLSDRVIMLTTGPGARIGKTLDIELPRPRNRLALAENADYHHYRREILGFLYDRHD